MGEHMSFAQQKSLAELVTAVVYQFIGWLIALIAVVLGASKDWMIWIPAGFMLLGVVIVRINIAVSGFKNEE